MAPPPKEVEEDSEDEEMSEDEDDSSGEEEVGCYLKNCVICSGRLTGSIRNNSQFGGCLGRVSYVVLSRVYCRFVGWFSLRFGENCLF